MLLLSDPTLAKLAASAVLLLTALLARGVVGRALLRWVTDSDQRRRWFVNARNITILLLVAALAAVWVSEIRTFATAVVAFAVALVIATKESIQCLNGSAMRAATNAYRVGDRIQIAGHRGDVIDYNMLTTTILEVGPDREYHLRTGRVIIIPNSRLLDSPLVNESFMKHYVLHVFSLPLKAEQDWKLAEEILLEAATEECAEFIDDAREHMASLEARYALDGLPVQPRVHIQIPDTGKLILLVRIPAPLGRQGRVEQAIVRRFLERFPAASEVAGAEPSRAPAAGGSVVQPKKPEPDMPL